ncbi:MAG TPA: hypothetical protein VM286_08735 [Candidatus Thermoplasmatota archaeon]|nr:hypothetical protein [Candidatus Thermoplasmatota archaeon]
MTNTAWEDGISYVCDAAAMTDKQRRHVELWNQANGQAAWVEVEPHLAGEADRGRRASTIHGMLRMADLIHSSGNSVDEIDAALVAAASKKNGGFTSDERVWIRRFYQGPNRPDDESLEGRLDAKRVDELLFSGLGPARPYGTHGDLRSHRVTSHMLALILYYIPLLWTDPYTRALFRFIHLGLHENGGRFTGMEHSILGDLTCKFNASGIRVIARLRPSKGPPNKRRIHWRIHASRQALVEVLRLHPMNVGHLDPMEFLAKHPDVILMIDPKHIEEGLHLQESTFDNMMRRFEAPLGISWHIGPNAYRRSRFRTATITLPRRLAQLATGHVIGSPMTIRYIGMEDEYLLQEREIGGYTQGVLGHQCPHCQEPVAELKGPCPACHDSLAPADPEFRRREAGRRLAKQVPLEGAW